MSKSYSQLWKEAGKIDKEGKSVAETNEAVAKLPYLLKDEFRQRQDPALDNAINQAQSDTFGAGIKGLDMYQGISNPFARRNLAEQYQGGVEVGWRNLTDERTRRQGVYADYIEKWTGLFGAEAAKKQAMFQNKISTWDREKNLADTEESQRRWEIENSRAERGSRGGSSKPMTDQEIRAFVYSNKNEMSWEDQREFLGSIGVDVEQGGIFDQAANGAWNTGNTPTKPKASTNNELSPTQEATRIKNENNQKNNDIRYKADNNLEDYYWSGDKIKKRKRGLFNWGLFALDEEVKPY